MTVPTKLKLCEMKVLGQLEKSEFNWRAKQAILGHIFPQTPRNQTSFLLIGGFLKPASLHFLKALEHCLQQIAALLPVLSDSQQPDAEGQLSTWTNLSLHIPYQNLIKAALPASACRHFAVLLWASGSCQTRQTAQIQGQRGFPARDPQCPGLAPCEQGLDRGCGTGTPRSLLQAAGASHSRPQTLGYMSAPPLTLPLKHLSCLVLVAQNPHSERCKGKNFTPISQSRSSLLFPWLSCMLEEAVT